MRKTILSLLILALFVIICGWAIWWQIGADNPEPQPSPTPAVSPTLSPMPSISHTLYPIVPPPPATPQQQGAASWG